MPKEGHFINRSNWLRAGVLGANDGILSTASLVVGVASAGMDRGDMLLTGLAGLVAGALSMAAGEYVSVSAQADVENADLERERVSLIENPDDELDELAEGLQQRGIESDLAREVASQMTEYDALGAHAREELGMFGLAGQANPLQAALASGAAFAMGASLPVMGALAAPQGYVGLCVALVTLAALALLGGGGAWLGGAPVRPGVVRVLSWGILAILASSAIGRLLGGVV